MIRECDVLLTSLSGLLDIFRQGYIINARAERTGINRHASSLSKIWDNVFPGFPSEYFPYTSFRGQRYRGRRDAYLKDIIVSLLTNHNLNRVTIVNPACVFGRHAVHLASRMRHAKVIGTDIDPGWNRAYRIIRGLRLPGNYTFVEDNIFTPQLQAKPTAVVFFGACGAVSDAAMDYAINSGTKYLMCRTCCHDNIGGNVFVTKQATNINRFFRFKNWAYNRMKYKARYAGYYFSEKYSHEDYPRSNAARMVSTADEFQAVAGHSADSDICRAIIDLDRCLHLIESGFSVVYQGELIVAEHIS